MSHSNYLSFYSFIFFFFTLKASFSSFTDGWKNIDANSCSCLSFSVSQCQIVSLLLLLNILSVPPYTQISLVFFHVGIYIYV